ncbi:hypothetical protein N665_1060s0020 [Sinapis alba]|nr:hypothetical protein N665_1060s0020 [Sinapis alba]
MATIKFDSDVSGTLSMFDSHVVSFHSHLDGFHGDSRVVVATSINPKIVGGRLFFNATSGTQIYLDKETNAAETYFYKGWSPKTLGTHHQLHCCGTIPRLSL